MHIKADMRNDKGSAYSAYTQSIIYNIYHNKFEHYNIFLYNG